MINHVLQGDMRREGLLDRQGCKIWSFPDERMSVPIMGYVP